MNVKKILEFVKNPVTAFRVPVKGKVDALHIRKRASHPFLVLSLGPDCPAAVDAKMFSGLVKEVESPFEAGRERREKWCPEAVLQALADFDKGRFPEDIEGTRSQLCNCPCGNVPHKPKVDRNTKKAEKPGHLIKVSFDLEFKVFLTDEIDTSVHARLLPEPGKGYQGFGDAPGKAATKETSRRYYYNRDIIRTVAHRPDVITDCGRNAGCQDADDAGPALPGGLQGLFKTPLSAKNDLGFTQRRGKNSGKGIHVLFVPEGMKEGDIVVGASIRAVDDGNPVRNGGCDRECPGEGAALSP
jgi:hypothetical protein